MNQIPLPCSPAFSVRRRQLLGLAGASLFTVATPHLAHAQASQLVQTNDAVRRAIGKATVVTDGLNLSLPLVAEDGSSVPLSVTDEGSPHGRITRLTLLATQNPTPEVAVFELGPEVATLKLSTRIRLSESQPVVAVAITENGHALVAERQVRVTTSGCVAPARSDPNNEMNARVRLPKTWKPGAPAEVLTMISHPMITGLAQDASGQTPDQRIIREFEATLNGEAVLSARYFRSMAANPYLRFDVAPQADGEIRFVWKEDTGRSVEYTENITLG